MVCYDHCVTFSVRLMLSLFVIITDSSPCTGICNYVTGASMHPISIVELFMLK